MNHKDENAPPVFIMGAIFGMGLSPEIGGPTAQEQVDAELRSHALAAAIIASDSNRRRRGRPVANWRKELRDEVLAVWNGDPTLKATLLAAALIASDLCKVRVSPLTMANWLSCIRKGGSGYGRQRV